MILHLGDEIEGQTCVKISIVCKLLLQPPCFVEQATSGSECIHGWELYSIHHDWKKPMFAFV